ncbi:MAG: hypothetical protein MJ236_03545 [Clostridia bacterium]|nr:hypothetical protein [Clostridia bacterium]
MNKNDYIIRLERKEEQKAVENMIRDSFWNVYRPGCLEHYVMHQIRNHSDFIPELNFVIEKDGKIIRQTVFVKAEIKSDDGKIIPIVTMGPICIENELKRHGYGKILLNPNLIFAYNYEYYYKNKYVYFWNKHLFTYFWYYFRYFPLGGRFKRNYNLTDFEPYIGKMSRYLEANFILYYRKFVWV